MVATSENDFDIAILGGGICGAAAAREAALAGWRVVLVEKGDFASGTSSRSSKLIHGGQRYLEQLQIPLVLESCRERAVLARLAPHLVRPLPFLFPVGEAGAPARPLLAGGLALYRALAAGGNLGPTSYHRRGAARLHAEAPRLSPEGWTGAYRYFDAQADDALLTLAFLRDAANRGASLHSYTEATKILRGKGGAVAGIEARGISTGRVLSVKCRSVICAMGPWTPALEALLGEGIHRPVRLTRGSHFFLPPGRLPVESAVVLLDSRNRRCYAIPWRGGTLLGTTDEDFAGPPDSVEPTADDRDLLLAAAKRFFPSAGLAPADLSAGFAGLRALPAAGAGKKPEEVTREEQIFEPARGVVAVYGGKLTTARRIARRVLTRAERILARDHAPSPGPLSNRESARTPLPEGDIEDVRALREKIRDRAGHSLRFSPARADRIVEREGSGAEAALGRMEADRRLARPLSEFLPYTYADFVWGVERAFARTAEDMLERRTRLSWESPREAEAAREMAEEAIRTVRREQVSE